jgi:glycosyltransferase involved in cell wall biosynthesis
MRVVVAGGIFGLSDEERRAREAAPEMTLADGLEALGHEAVRMSLSDTAAMRRTRGVDIFHIHHLSRVAVEAALLPTVRPFVFTEHQTGPASTRSRRMAQRLCLHLANQVICLSETEASEKRSRYNLSSSRLTVIPNGVAVPGRFTGRRDWTAGEPFRLLFVGQLIDWKQVPRAITALKHLPENVSLRLVYHNAELEFELRHLTTELNLAHRVDFAGRKSGEDLYREYMNANALVLPSAPREALPSVVTEALQTGLPVVGSAAGAIAEQVGSAGVIVSTNRDDSISPAIDSLMDDYVAFAERAVARGSELRDQYTPSRMAQDHVRLYERLLSS